MGIVLINSKTKIKFPYGFTFLFYEAIIAQPFSFVNRYKKFFSCTFTQSATLPFADAESATFALTQPHPYSHTSTHSLTILRVFVDELVGSHINFSHLSIYLYVYISIQTSLNLSTYLQNFAHGLVYALTELYTTTYLNSCLWR